MNGAIVPLQSPPTTAAATSLAPGFRFHPTDEELVIYYLKRKVSGRSLRIDAIAEVDLYKSEPWELPGLSRLQSRDQEWYFFSPLDRKYSNRSRTNRATAKGYWKTTGKDRPVHHGDRVVGMKKTLVYHDGRPPRGKRSNWVMHEYRLDGEQLVDVPQDGYVVCRIFQKKGSGPMNGAQYGAPFVEEEWEEEANGSVMLPDGVEYESNDDGEPPFLEVNDFLLNQDLGNDDTSLFLVDSDAQSIINHQEEADNLLEDILKDSSLVSDMLDGNEEPGQQIGPTISDVSQERPSENVSYVSLGQDIDHCPESANFSFGTSHPESFLDGVGKSSNLQKILDFEEFYDATSSYFDQQELLPISPLQDTLDSQLNERNFSGPETEYGLSCYDAPDYNLAFTDDKMDGIFSSSIAQQSDFQMIDDLMAYFDATDANPKYSTRDYLEGSEYLGNSKSPNEVNCDTWKTSKARTDSLANVSDGSSSSDKPMASHQFRNKLNEFTVRPGTGKQLNEGRDRRSLLANMIGAIPAPPAFAAESLVVKSIEQMSLDGSSSSLIKTGLIRMHHLAVSSNVKKKDGILSPCWEAVDIPGKNEPATKFLDSLMSVVFRGGFYLFFFSAISLGLSYKLGIRVC